MRKFLLPLQKKTSKIFFSTRYSSTKNLIMKLSSKLTLLSRYSIPQKDMFRKRNKCLLDPSSKYPLLNLFMPITLLFKRCLKTWKQKMIMEIKEIKIVQMFCKSEMHNPSKIFYFKNKNKSLLPTKS